MNMRDTDTGHFPLIEVAGTAYQRGRQHGSAAPERVARSARLYRRQLMRQGLGGDRLTRLALGMRAVIQRFDSAYLDEMQGIADGAGVSLADVILINCRTEMMFCHSDLKMVCRELEDRCTGLVVLPEHAAAGRLMHAHNWDWRQECADTGIVLRIRRDGADQPDLLLFAEAGALGRHGFNGAGLSMSGNFLSSDRDYRQLADVPLALVRRKMLEAPDMGSAMKILWRTRRFCSRNLMLAHAGVDRVGQALGDAVNLECAPDEIFWQAPQHGLLVHADHWLCPVARGKLRELGLAANPDSLYRQQRVETVLQQALRRGSQKIDWACIKHVLAGDFLYAGGVLRKPDAEGRHATVATTLMDAGAGAMWIARNPCRSQAFTEYRL
ncbi:acyl-coenzyme A:6-aminopenicillanic acid acyl-transferase family protein [Collimonas pratensis]|uniref:Acyl-coenzyme A:6-aminopenicillanic acid acyl-transferase family protein n=2 Tax=Collimonas pratensis TaxID=279113 RepID=A0A127Q5Z5_9BURK|nr:acyl-coenzyme A:6-aminopenicillanic acid acyl-transferase family protein [Collimonas pratensis]